MGAALKIDDILTRERAPAPLSSADLEEVASRQALDELQPRLERLRRGLETYEQGVAQSTIDLGRLVDLVENDPPENLDEVIDDLLRLERRQCKGLWPEIERVERRLAQLHKQPPSYRVNLGVINQRYRGAMIQDLEQIRDTRWRLMAFRAERFPSKPVGPVRGKPTNLKAYLASLRH